MQIEFGPQIIQSYRRLSYTEWYALAEFIDNSTEAYFANKEALDEALGDEKLEVRIKYDQVGNTLTVSDNSIGMSEEELKNALKVGWTPAFAGGRSRYGLGMKTAACWLGDFWTIRTKKLSETQEHTVTVDVDQVANDNIELPYTVVDDRPLGEHYTSITISNLNRKFGGRTIQKVKDYLRSMYRRDFENYGLRLYWQDGLLAWDYATMIDSRLIKLKDGTLKRKEFEFTVGSDGDTKSVNGWVGVFAKGSRKDAGFSILQKDRVIKGWPDPYKPELIFGESRNDLVNQRLVGELFMDDFAVSHTKDEILFVNNDEDELEVSLLEACEEFKTFANEYRKYLDDDRLPTANQEERALDALKSELLSDIFKSRLTSNSIPSDKLLREMWSGLINAVMFRREANLKVDLDKVIISIYIDPELSPDDPYVLIDVGEDEHRVTVIFNNAHPNWSYMTTDSDIQNFVRHYTFDGVAEWKAKFVTKRPTVETIKFIKDDLLRVPLEIESAEEL